MKLIRLATNNNGIFSNGFGNEMIIKPFSKMALLNLTFKSSAGGLFTTTSDMSIITQTDTSDASTKKEITLRNKSYTLDTAGFDLFLADLVEDLNKTLVLGRGQSAGIPDLVENSSGSQYAISTDKDGNKEIVFRYAAFVNCLGSDTWMQRILNKDLGGDFFNILDTSKLNSTTTTSVTTPRKEQITIFNDTDGAALGAVNDNSANIITSSEICPGAGFCSVRVHDLVTNAGSGNNNGFGIGLAKRDLVATDNENEVIASADIFMDLRINRAGEKFKYTSDAEPNQELSTDFDPLNTSILTEPDLTKHDVMGFEIRQGKAVMCVYQDRGFIVGEPQRQRREIISLDIPTGQKLYPYLYIRGAGAGANAASPTIPDCTADMFNFTYNSLQYMDISGVGGDTYIGGQWGLGDTNKLQALSLAHGQVGNGNSYNEHIYSTTNRIMGTGMPQVAMGGVIGEGQSRWQKSLTMTLKLPAGILDVLGFQKGKTDYSGFIEDPSFSTAFSGTKLPVVTQNSENYIVESMTLPLDSYDASEREYGAITSGNNGGIIQVGAEKKGRRKNILMTIPVDFVAGQSTTFRYQANTPIFIDINNANEQNVKNLNFRILRQDFSNLVNESTEDSIMTLLIDN